jgi:hypothetical protein
MRIYLSHPMSIGCADAHVASANTIELRLIQSGRAVFNPVRSFYNLQAQRELSHSQWLANDCAWVEKSDVVLRIPGLSVGCDMEVAHARQHGVGVVTPSYFECLNDLFEPGPATLCQTDLDNLMRWVLFRDREEIRETVLEGFERAKQAV